MSDLRTAAQEALDHLQDWERGGIDTKIIDTLRVALAADSVAEEAITDDEGRGEVYASPTAAPVALSPKPPKPLTVEEIREIRARPECWEHVGERIEFRELPFARCIERAHGITPADQGLDKKNEV